MNNNKSMNTKEEKKNNDDITNTKIQLLLNNKLGDLLLKMPKKGVIKYEKENKFWMIELDPKWNQNIYKFSELVYNLYNDTKWYENGYKRGIMWSNLLKEDNIIIKIMPPTSISGLHITLGRFDINDQKKPKCLIENKMVEFQILRLVCFPPFNQFPRNLPGQKIDDKGYRFYSTFWISADIKFINFNFKPRFPPHISLSNIAVKLKAEEVDKLNL